MHTKQEHRKKEKNPPESHGSVLPVFVSKQPFESSVTVLFYLSTLPSCFLLWWALLWKWEAFVLKEIVIAVLQLFLQILEIRKCLTSQFFSLSFLVKENWWGSPLFKQHICKGQFNFQAFAINVRAGKRSQKIA